MRIQQLLNKYVTENFLNLKVGLPDELELDLLGFHNLD